MRESRWIMAVGLVLAGIGPAQADPVRVSGGVSAAASAPGGVSAVIVPELPQTGPTLSGHPPEPIAPAAAAPFITREPEPVRAAAKEPQHLGFVGPEPAAALLLITGAGFTARGWLRRR